jgi:hypothetical protein
MCIRGVCLAFQSGSALTNILPLTRLQVLRLGNNSFSGPVFPSLTSFRELVVLDLNGTCVQLVYLV